MKNHLYNLFCSFFFNILQIRYLICKFAVWKKCFQNRFFRTNWFINLSHYYPNYMPIVWGPKKTKLFIYLLILLVVLLLLTVNALHWRFLTDLTLKYTLAIIVVPLLLLVYFIHKAGTPAEYHQISNWLKIIMVAGISYGFIFYYIIAVAFHINIFNIFIVK